MPIEKSFYKENVDLQKEVISEIEKVEGGQSKRNIIQLQTILRDLENMLKDKHMNLVYPRIIIDSWDYADQLGIKLMKLAEMYTAGVATEKGT